MLSIRSFLTGILLSVSASTAFASYIYESEYLNWGKEYSYLLQKLPTDDIRQLPQDKQLTCQKRYSTILNDDVIDIRVALGYFDFTTGANVYYRGRSFGVSPSIDLGAFSALRVLLLSPCRGNLQFCGFSQDPNDYYLFRKSVQIRGRVYPVRLTMHFSSTSEYLDQNVSSDAQERRTSFLQNFFYKGLQKADAMLYFGHARDGGGPDFSPPVFVPGRNKVNYDGYYKVRRPGLRRMLSSLSEGQGQAPIIGMMACDSRDHFLTKLRTTAPRSGVITSLNVLKTDMVFTALIGTVDALLRGQCQKSFYQELRMTTQNRDNITMDGMFE